MMIVSECSLENIWVQFVRRSVIMQNRHADRISARKMFLNKILKISGGGFRVRAASSILNYLTMDY